LAVSFEAAWHERGLRRRLCRRTPEVTFKSRSWRPAPQSIHALIAEPYDGAIEERECDLQFWQHWAQVQEYRPYLQPSVFVWPRRFRICVAAVSCAPLWCRRLPLSGCCIGGVDISCMDRLASTRHFPWASSTAADSAPPKGRARFPCELWLQKHTVLREFESCRSVLCDVDVLEQQLQVLNFDTVRLKLPRSVATHGGVHALATWTEVVDSDGEVCWSSAAFQASEGGDEQIAPGAFKQGVLLAENPWCGASRGENSVEKDPTPKRARKASTTPTWIEVQATFDPARGELRLIARWDDGRPF